ncbi:MAG: hypothetical protein H7145_21945 [Akkermansiaceae bacterium]|nr:hypothetical protein [Armatimonadota bacterium]
MFKSDWRTRRVAGIGIVGLDHVAVTDRWERDMKSTATRYFEQVGGPVPVALMAMARLGLDEPPLFVGNIGEDTAGDEVLNVLQECGVSSEFTRARAGHRTPHLLVVLDTSDSTRALANFPGTLSEEPILSPWTPFSDTGLMHTDGRETRWALRIRENLRGMLSLDLGSSRPTHRDLLPSCDIIIASKVGGAGTFPDYADDPIEQTNRFLELGATVAGVTLGADGVVIGCRDENGGDPVHVPAFKVENVVDTCGAGDLFHGAFLWAYREGKTVIESATFAQAAVALRIQHYGNVAGQPTREQVEAFLATHGGFTHR